MSVFDVRCHAEVWEKGGQTHRCKRNGWFHLLAKDVDRDFIVCGSHFKAGLRGGLWLFGGNPAMSTWYDFSRLEGVPKREALVS